MTQTVRAPSCTPTLPPDLSPVRKDPHVLDARIAAVLPAMDAPFFQAGLAGYSDAAMRLLARRHGCPLCVTEALLDRLLLDGGKGLLKADLHHLARTVPDGAADHPIVGQIIGTQPDSMAAAAGILVDFGYDVIDVNLACPVKKIARKCRGGHFLANPQDAIAVLDAVRRAVPPEIPTSVKLRRGSDDSDESVDHFDTIFNTAYDLGYAWTTVHGRTVSQKYNGPSNWMFLRRLVERHPDKLVFGSGDVWSAHDIFKMIAMTGVQAVSVARGCIGNPWVFRQARELMAGRDPQPPTLTEQRRVLEDHFELCLAEHGPRMAGRLMRKFGIMFSRHHPTPDTVKQQFINVTNPDDWRRVLDDHYNPDSTVSNQSSGS
ncbi:MAG: tRNA-dihydrouridine synthase [Planctomycetes bacterium]|nr:tRNA-dihydrouridine synthase [Planctomycetota bacterium]